MTEHRRGSTTPAHGGAGRLELGSLGGYRLVERLGRDSTGTVYRARSAAGEEVAVKVIAPVLAADEEFMDGLRSPEGDGPAGLSTVLDSDLHGPRPYLVTPLREVATESFPTPPVAPPPSTSTGRRARSSPGRERGTRWPPLARLAVVVVAVGLVIAAVAAVRIWLDDGPPGPVETVYRQAGERVVETGPATPVRRVAVPVNGPMPQATMVGVVVASSAGEAGEAGVFCHGVGGDGYELTLRGDGRAVIAKIAGGKRVVLGAGTFEAGRETSMVAACVRERTTPLVRLSLWLDGGRVVDAVDGRASLRAGSAGLVARRAAGGRGPERTVFKDLQVSRF